MESRKILVFGIDADGVVFNLEFDQHVAGLQKNISNAERQKIILDERISIKSNEKLLSWIGSIIEKECPSAVYFISFSNRQDVSLDFGNRQMKKNSLFMPVFEQLVQEVIDRFKKPFEKNYQPLIIKLLRNTLADLHSESRATLKKEEAQEFKALHLQGWNAANKNPDFDESKLNIFNFIMYQSYVSAQNDFPDEGFIIRYHFIDDCKTIIEPLCMIAKKFPGFIIKKMTASFYQYCSDGTITTLDLVHGQGGFDENYQEHIKTLSLMAYCDRQNIEMTAYPVKQKNLIKAMTDQSARYQLEHYLEYVKNDNVFQIQGSAVLDLSAVIEEIAASSSRLVKIEELVGKRQELLYAKTLETGDSLLILFVKKGWYLEAEKLILLGADPAYKNKFGLTIEDLLPSKKLLGLSQSQEFVKTKHTTVTETTKIKMEGCFFENSTVVETEKTKVKLQRSNAFSGMSDLFKSDVSSHSFVRKRKHEDGENNQTDPSAKKRKLYPEKEQTKKPDVFFQEAQEKDSRLSSEDQKGLGQSL